MNAPEPWRLARRDRILAAATTLFASQSYAEVQMDDVARAAGMGKPTLYRYFPSKAELFFAAFDQMLETLETRLEAIATSGEAPLRQIDAMVQALFEVLAEQISTLMYLEGESGEMAGRWRGVYRQRRRGITDRLRTVLETGMARGEFRDLDLESTPALIMGMVRGGLMGAPSIPRERLTQAAQQFVRQAVMKA